VSGRWIYITAEPLVPQRNLVEFEIAIGKLKSFKSPGTDQIPAELIKAGGETSCSQIQRLICCIWNKEPVPVAERSKAHTVFERSNIGIVCLNPTPGIDVCPRFSVLFCAV
jgi:hypothetical protein